MDSDRSSTSRRQYLYTLAGTALVSGTAGCNTDPGGSDTTQPESDTQTSVVFTDTATRTDDQPTPESDATGTNETTPAETTNTHDSTTSSFTPTPTETPTSTPTDVVFNSGDGPAFADAVRTAASLGVPLVIDPGTYEFDPVSPQSGRQKYSHLEFREVEGLTIEGNGAKITFTDPQAGGLRFTASQDITIRDLTLDYDPVPFTQGEITAVSTSDHTLTVALDAGYPDLNHEMFGAAAEVYGLVHQSDGNFITGIRTDGSPDKFFATTESVDRRKFRLKLTGHSDFTGIAVGNRLSIVARDNQTALRCYKVTNPTFENVTIRTSNGAAFVMGVCETPSFQGCTITPPPNSDRQIASVADGIRITNCIGGSTIENCRHERLGDDSIAVDNHMATLTGFESDRTVTVDGVHPFVVKAGDALDAISPSGIIRGTLPPIKSYEALFPPVGDRGKPETITFEEPVRDTLEAGDYLSSTVADSSGYTIRNNTFRNHRANLIRANTSNGLIKDNTLDGVDGNAIELHTGTRGYWPPTCWVTDVTVRGNKIRRAGMRYIAGDEAAAIYLHHETPSGVATEARPNQDITIVDNDIANCASIGIKAEATEGLQVKGNSMRALNQLDYENGGFGIDIANIQNGTVQANNVTGSSELLSSFGIRRSCEQITATENTTTVDGTDREGELVYLVPVTFRFNRSVSAGNRQLTFRCFSLSLLDDSGGVIRKTNVGGDISGITFGEGVDAREQHDGQTWRWFGPEDEISVLYIYSDDLERATALRLDGYAIENGIAASVSVDGVKTDEIEWDDSNRDQYTVSLE